MMRYVLEYYPDKKLLGLVLRQPIAKFLLKKYHFIDLSFEDTFIEYHEFVLRRNLQQILTTPKQELIKFNEQIGSPSQMGLLINYGFNFSDKNITHFIEEIKSYKPKGAALKEFFFNYFDKNQSDFLKAYVTARKPFDLRFSEDKERDGNITFIVEEKNNFSPPFFYRISQK